MKAIIKNFLKGALLTGCIIYSPVKTDPFTEFLLSLYDIPASLVSRPVTSLAITIWLGRKIWGSGQEWVYAENKWSLIPHGIATIQKNPGISAIGVAVLTIAYYFTQQENNRKKAEAARQPVTTVTQKQQQAPKQKQDLCPNCAK